jgi:hypothetical protein
MEDLKEDKSKLRRRVTRTGRKEKKRQSKHTLGKYDRHVNKEEGRQKNL